MSLNFFMAVFLKIGGQGSIFFLPFFRIFFLFFVIGREKFGVWGVRGRYGVSWGGTKLFLRKILGGPPGLISLSYKWIFI